MLLSSEGGGDYRVKKEYGTEKFSSKGKEKNVAYSQAIMVPYDIRLGIWRR